MMDMCNVIIICPCNTSMSTKIVKLGLKTFETVLQEVKKCSCRFVSAAGKVDRAEKWTDLASDVVSTPTHQLGSVVSGVTSLFQFRYLVSRVNGCHKFP